MTYSSLSRRKFVSLGLIGGAASVGAALVGCSPKSPSEQDAPLGDTGSSPYPQIDLCGRPSMSEIEQNRSPLMTPKKPMMWWSSAQEPRAYRPP